MSIARRAIAGIPLVLLVAATGASCASCNGSSTDPPPLGLDDLVLRAVASGFAAPLHLTAPTGDPRLFVVEKGGRIRS